MNEQEEKVLSQAEIDALVSIMPPKLEVAAPAATVTTPPPRPAQPAPATPAAPRQRQTASAQPFTYDRVDKLQSMVADLAREVGRLTSISQRVDNLGELVDRMTVLLKLSPTAITPVSEQIDEVARKLDELALEIRSKPDCALRADFQCGKCHSKEVMAVHVKCTSCGEENWTGWWPDK